MVNFIINLGSHNDYCEVMFNDVLNESNVYFENNRNYLKNKLLRFAHRIHTNKRINRVVSLPLKSMWYRFYSR